MKCATIVKEKSQNFPLDVCITALVTMATKSSYKLREELMKQPPVRKLCQRIQNALKDPVQADRLPLDRLSTAGWALQRFPDEAMGDAKVTLGASVQRLVRTSNGAWPINEAAKVLWCLAKAECIIPHKHVATIVVKELIRDRGRRVEESSLENLVNLLWAVGKARAHIREGELKMSRMEPSDEKFFAYASKRLRDHIDEVDPTLLCELANTHAEVGIRDEPLFKAMCPRIVAKSKDIQDKIMSKAIKAYARFMIPLREAQQGFRTLAVVAKGDFVRPSDKPSGPRGPKKYDKPQSLYPSTQLHSRG